MEDPFGRAESDDLPRTVCGKLLWGGTCGPRRIDPRMFSSISQHRWFLRLIAKLRGGKGMLLRRGRLTRVRLNPLLVVLDILVDGSQGFGLVTSLDEGNDLRA